MLSGTELYIYWYYSLMGKKKTRRKLIKFLILHFRDSCTSYRRGFPGGSVVKNSPVHARGNAGDMNSIPG